MKYIFRKSLLKKLVCLYIPAKKELNYRGMNKCRTLRSKLFGCNHNTNDYYTFTCLKECKVLLEVMEIDSEV